MALALGILANAVPPANAATVGISDEFTPTWGTTKIEGTVYSGRVWDMAVHNDITYIAGEFDGVAPTIEFSGAIDGSSGLPQPGFPSIVGGEVKVSVPDGEGGWFVGGSFTEINGAVRRGLAHVRADGTVDDRWLPVFPGTAGPFTVWALARQGSYIYVGGEFTRFANPGTTRNHIARLNTFDGAVDRGWDPDANGVVKSIAVSPDGNDVYIAGDFTALRAGTVPRPGLALINGAGGIAEWQPALGAVQSIAVAPDGSRAYVGGASLAAVDRSGGVAWSVPAGSVESLTLSRPGTMVYVGGDFSSVGGQPRQNLAAVDAATGAVDPSWAPVVSGPVSSLTLSDDGTMVYAGGTFDKVRDYQRNNLAAINAATGTLEAWDPNANGSVSSVSASGPRVFVGGNFTGLGAQVRTKLAAIDLHNGAPVSWAPLVQNLDANGNPDAEPAVVQAITLSADATPRIFIGGNFSHVNGVPRKHLAALTLTGQLDESFRPGEPQGTVRSLAVWGNTLYVGGDFQSIRVRGSVHGTDRPDNPCPPGAPKCSPVNTSGGTSEWARPGLIAAFDATTGFIDVNFDETPASTGPGLVGQSGKAESAGNGSVKSIGISADGTYLYAGGTFSELGGQLGLMSLHRGDGSFTPWQPDLNSPVFDLTIFVGDGRTLFTANGGAGGRLHRFDPHTGSTSPAWSVVTDGDATAVETSPTAVYLGGHYDFSDNTKRKHASAYSPSGELVETFVPALDTDTGPFTVKVAPRQVIWGGEFSRAGKSAQDSGGRWRDLFKPQPGIAMYPGTP
ncbi:MAG TPA: hypothetical protein VI854_09370 [Acidimicrobiia bacterium]|nr:hypothetical protein [Acidimicrobiia bacterium]